MRGRSTLENAGTNEMNKVAFGSESFLANDAIRFTPSPIPTQMRRYLRKQNSRQGLYGSYGFLQF